MRLYLYILFISTLLSTACSSDDNLGFPSGGSEVIPVPNAVDKTVVIEDEYEGVSIVVTGNTAKNFIVVFHRNFNGTILDFSETTDPLPAIMQDNKGNVWDIFGHAISGPDSGEKLTPLLSYMGYWFSFATFYPGAEIHELSGKGEFEGEEITGTGGWLVPLGEVRDGGPGRDGIPAISNPQFVNASDVDFLFDGSLVIGYRDGDEIKAYPHIVMDWHEIVNDQGGGNGNIAIIYCPLTGTGTAWSRNLSRGSVSFGVSGRLYNSNIVPFDRETNSNWSQILNVSINGTYINESPPNFFVMETTWKTWKEMYPNSKVMTTNTGFSRSYGTYPYGNYRSNSTLIFPVKYRDERLHPKERVLGVIINGEVKVYRFDSFK